MERGDVEDRSGGAGSGGEAMGPAGAGTVATPRGGGRMAAACCLVSSRPAVPAARISRPAAMAIAAGLVMDIRCVGTASLRYPWAAARLAGRGTGSGRRRDEHEHRRR